MDLEFVRRDAQKKGGLSAEMTRRDKKHVMLCPRSRHLELTLTAIAKAVWIQAFLKCLTFNSADSSDLEWLLYSECDYKIWKVVHVALRFCAHFRYLVFVPYCATADRKGHAYTVILLYYHIFIYFLPSGELT